MSAIFQAEVWCDVCAEELRDRLWKEYSDWVLFDSRVIWERFQGFDDERAYDSCEYPKDHPDSEEADSPTYCRGCGAFLENDLTTEGADYVIKTVRDDLASGNTNSVACIVWRVFYDYLDFSGSEPYDN